MPRQREFHLITALTTLTIMTALLSAVAGAQSPVPPITPHLCAEAKAKWWADFFEGARSSLPSQENYDVEHYDLDIYIQMGFQRKIVGTTTMRAEVVNSAISQVDMDFEGNKFVDSVKVAGLPSTFTQSTAHVTVDLDRTYSPGEEFTVAVSYHGVIMGGGLMSESRPTGILIWSLSSVYEARKWWPCKDWPWDKADSVDVHIDVPDNMIAVSNGVLTDVEAYEARAVYHWHEKYPISTYLVSIACHPYTQFSDWYHYAPGESMEVRHHVFPDHYDAVAESVLVTVPALELFAQLFGEYPFVDEKYGHAEVDWSGGMEHQTCCSIGAWPQYLIVHELAHQWYGDMITCETFHHIWLNEGFATYAEALWWEEVSGVETYHTDMGWKEYLGGGTIFVEDPENEEIFDYDLSYAKGAWVLHMLRHVVGDSVFFDILPAYSASGMRYGTATTEDFRDLCESASGLELDQFFHQWIYEEYYPVYAYDWSSEAVGPDFRVDLSINQLQTNHVFHMPIDITVYTSSGETTLVVGDSLAHQEFDLVVNDEPTGVELDRDRWILRVIAEPLSDPSFDRGILLVNGVSFSFFEDEITSAYEDSVFWGDHNITFWDAYDQVVPYPSTLPEPLGHGPVPPDTLKQFSAVVWVSGDYGDEYRWHDTPMLPYLQAGGNVLLLSRTPGHLLNPALNDYLGVSNWEAGSIAECVSVYPGLVDMNLIGAQTNCDVTDTTLTQAESVLLFTEVGGLPESKGLGVWRHPVDGGEYRPDGGQFVIVAGRPYRWSHDELRANVQYILDYFFEEPYDPSSSVASTGGAAALSLSPARPNPFNPEATISFSLPGKSQASLRIYDVKGRLVTTLAEGETDAGTHAVTWRGTDNHGRHVASGVYFCRLTSGGLEISRKIVLAR